MQQNGSTGFVEALGFVSTRPPGSDEDVLPEMIGTTGASLDGEETPAPPDPAGDGEFVGTELANCASNTPTEATRQGGPARTISETAFGGQASTVCSRRPG